MGSLARVGSQEMWARTFFLFVASTPPVPDSSYKVSPNSFEHLSCQEGPQVPAGPRAEPQAELPLWLQVSHPWLSSLGWEMSSLKSELVSELGRSSVGPRNQAHVILARL